MQAQPYRCACSVYKFIQLIMTKIISVLFFIAIFSCNRNIKESVPKEVVEDTTSQSFFPVTSFIKGQIFELKNEGISPIMYTTTNNKKDSVWLKVENIDSVVKPFLDPLIDSTNLKNTFKETSFLDQTLNAYTFSFDPIGKLSANYELKQWDIYIDHETSRVTRIYILKKEINGTIVQLTWQADKYCRMVWIKDSVSPVVVKEILINWRI